MKGKRCLKKILKMVVLFIGGMAVICGVIRLIYLEPKFYLKDYPTIYQDKLNTIFGDNYSVGPRQLKYEFSERVNAPSTFKCYCTWEITYSDDFGRKYTVELCNIDGESFYERSYFIDNQARWWKHEQIEKHYRFLLENELVNIYGSGQMDFSIEEVLGSKFSMICKYNSENKELNSALADCNVWREKIYERVQSSLEPLPKLYMLDYGNIFMEKPYIYYVYLNESVFTDEAVNIIVNVLSKETKGVFNLVIGVKREDSTYEDKQFFIWGEKEDIYKNICDYNLEVYNKYKESGMFNLI